MRPWLQLLLAFERDFYDEKDDKLIMCLMEYEGETRVFFYK